MQNSDVSQDILQHVVTMPLYMNPFLLEVFSFLFFVFVFVFVCVFVIVNLCQEGVNIINFPQKYNRLGFWP